MDDKAMSAQDATKRGYDYSGPGTPPPAATDDRLLAEGTARVGTRDNESAARGEPNDGQRVGEGHVNETSDDDNSNRLVGTSGLDTAGEFRIADRMTIGVNGGKIRLRRAGDVHTVDVGEAELAAAIEDKFFDN